MFANHGKELGEALMETINATFTYIFISFKSPFYGMRIAFFF
jgi:hypothetical protein